MVLTSSLEASSGARACDAALACSTSKDFCKDSLPLNDEIGQRRFQRYSRVLSSQPHNRAILPLTPECPPLVGIEPVHFGIEVERIPKK